MLSFRPKVLPRPLRGPALSLLLTGCTAHQAKPPVHQRPPAPTTSSETTEAVPAFDHSSRIYQAYQALRTRDLLPNELDVGCHVVRAYRPGPNEELLYADNGTIEECEVAEHILDRWDHDAGYRKLAHDLIGKEVPLDLSTAYQEDAKKVIQQLRSLLEAQGLSPERNRFKIRLATGLFYFALFPTDPSWLHSHPELKEVLEKLLPELDEIGLKVFRDTLYNKGGWGLIENREDGLDELSVQETLKQKRGWCTEQSKVLYALFKLAGLEPFFVYARIAEMDEVLKGYNRPVPNIARLDDHIFIGIQLRNRRRYFDASIILSKAEYPNYYPLRLRQYLAADLSNQARHLGQRHQTTEAVELMKTAAFLWPDANVILQNSAMFAADLDDLENAQQILTRLEKLYPDDTRVHTIKGIILQKQGKLRSAATAYNAAILKDPKNPIPYLRLGQMHILYTSDIHTAFRALSTAAELDPLNAMTQNDLGALLLTLGKEAEAEAAFKRAIDLGIDNGFPFANLALIQLNRDEFDKSWRNLNFAQGISPELGFVDSVFAIYYAKKKDLPASEKSFREAIRKEPKNLLYRANLIATLAAQESRDKLREAEHLLEQLERIAPNHERVRGLRKGIEIEKKKLSGK